MSLAYQVTLQLEALIAASDRTVHRLDLQPILPRDEMVRLLREALLERGFTETNDTTLTRTDAGDVEVTIVLTTLEVTATLEREQIARGHTDLWVDEDLPKEHQTALIRNTEQSQRELLAERAHKDAQQAVTAALEADEPARLRELNEALEDVYARALKRRAAQLGDIVELHEGRDEDGQYELVIKVEI